jgi:hypothetical protein
MNRNISLRPSKPTSVGGLIGLVFMFFFGIGFSILVGNVLHENEAPLAASALFFLFMTGWIGTVLYLLVYHFLNLRRVGGLPLVEIETEGKTREDAAEIEPARKLRSLEQLKKDGLVNQEEYARKRSEILEEKW